MREFQDVGRMQFLLTLRKRGIADNNVLRAMEEVPRAEFVQADFTAAAYADQALPIACGQTISQPYVVAYMTEQLGAKPEHRVLEIGTGSGYRPRSSPSSRARWSALSASAPWPTPRANA